MAEIVQTTAFLFTVHVLWDIMVRDVKIEVINFRPNITIVYNSLLSGP